MWSFAAQQWQSQDVFIGGASNQPGVAQKSTLFQYKNVVDYNILDNFSAKNTAEYNYFILNIIIYKYLNYN